MSQVSDLSRSLVPFDQNITLTVVVELSEASWLVAGLIPGVDRQPVKKQEPEPVALSRHRGARCSLNQRRRVTRASPSQDRSAGYGDAPACVPGMAARRARALPDGGDPNARARGRQASEP